MLPCCTVCPRYTPCTLDCHVGYFDLMFKVYKAGVHERFPDGGKMSQYVISRGYIQPFVELISSEEPICIFTG